MKFLLKSIDSGIYLLFGPFSVLYLFPKFCREIESQWYILPSFDLLDWVGMIFMWMGGCIALSCGVVMFLNKFGSVVPFFKPTKLVASGPYALVRHPMMWALFLVIFGEAVSYSSLLTLLWLILWIRFSFLYISKYEEPYLYRVFGDDYVEYAKKVPAWFPFTKPKK